MSLFLFANRQCFDIMYKVSEKKQERVREGEKKGSEALPVRRGEERLTEHQIRSIILQVHFSGIKMNYGLIFGGFYSWIPVAREEPIASSTGDRNLFIFLSPVQLATASWTDDRGQQGSCRQFNWR